MPASPTQRGTRLEGEGHRPRHPHRPRHLSQRRMGCTVRSRARVRTSQQGKGDIRATRMRQERGSMCQLGKASTRQRPR